MFLTFFLYLSIASLVLANTETYLLKIPNYYDIPTPQRQYLLNHISKINATTTLIDEYPILDVYNYNLENTELELPYDYVSKTEQKLFVKLNNYQNKTFDSNDLINVKLCWPATYPFDFSLSHEFIRAGEFENTPESNTLDIYVVITYQADFYAVKEVTDQTIKFHLVVSKLPNSIPIPIELYDFIVYAVDLCILMWSLFPFAESLIWKMT